MSESDSTIPAYDPNQLPEHLRRFRVDADTGCWLWLGSLDERGYALARKIKGSDPKAFRAIHAFFHGPFKVAIHLHHKCRNRSCVNPAHGVRLTPEKHAAVHRTTAEIIGPKKPRLKNRPRGRYANSPRVRFKEDLT